MSHSLSTYSGPNDIDIHGSFLGLSAIFGRQREGDNFLHGE